MNQIDNYPEKSFIADVIGDVKLRESFLRDLIHVIDNSGLIIPEDGQIKIESIDNMISISIPVAIK